MYTQSIKPLQIGIEKQFGIIFMRGDVIAYRAVHHSETAKTFSTSFSASDLTAHVQLLQP